MRGTDGFTWPNPDEAKLAVNMSWLVDWEFGLLERHRNEMFASLNRFMDKADDIYRDFEKTWELSYEDVSDSPGYDLLAEEYRMATEFIPRVQWNAQFLMVFSTFENLICRLADVAKVRFNQRASYREFSGQGLEQAIKYLKVIAGLQKTLQSREWNAIDTYKALRNSLAHRRGEFAWSEDPSNLGQKLKKSKLAHWEVDDQREGVLCSISLSPDFVEEAIKTLRAAALQVCNAKFDPAQS